MSAGKEFTPRMRAEARLFRTLDPLAYRRFAGVVADVWHMAAERGAGGFYISPDPRIVIFLDQDIPAQRLRFSDDSQKMGEETTARAFYVPAGIPLWSNLEAQRNFTHLDFHFETSSLCRRLKSAGIRADITRPRIISESALLASVGELAAREVRYPRPGEAILDGLFLATLGEIFGLTESTGDQPASGTLTPYQLSLLAKHLQQEISRHVSVCELAEVVGLSASWFAHCFKNSTGETPQHWQNRIRLESAKQMMADPSVTLAEVAHATGFADQSHFSRQFRSSFGEPPSAWRRNKIQWPQSNQRA